MLYRTAKGRVRRCSRKRLTPTALLRPSHKHGTSDVSHPAPYPQLYINSTRFIFSQFSPKSGCASFAFPEWPPLSAT